MRTEPSEEYEAEAGDATLAAYHRGLAAMAELLVQLAAEPPEGEVADLLRQRGQEPSREALEDWYGRWYADQAEAVRTQP